LLKLGISLDKRTIAKILTDFRKKGKIKNGLTWKRFLKAHIRTLFAIDLFTVDTVLGKRYYVFFLIRHFSRKIIQYGITTNPSREFIRQQIIEFSHTLAEPVYVIHDRSPELYLNYKDYNINEVVISVSSPNMSAIAERFVGSVRKEALDWFIIFSERQLNNILKEYIRYYNHFRPHQGIDQQVPCGYEQQVEGEVVSRPFLSGLHRHYYRKTA
jgi:transposase InsO family protein